MNVVHHPMIIILVVHYHQIIFVVHCRKEIGSGNVVLVVAVQYVEQCIHPCINAHSRRVAMYAFL